MPGRAPPGWEAVRIGKMCALSRDADPASDTYVGIEHIVPGRNGVSGTASAGDFATHRPFRERDILYAKLGPAANKVWLATCAGRCSTDILPIRADPNLVLPEFLVRVMASPRFVGHAVSTSSGTIMPRTSWRDIQRFTVHVPPMREQQKIASILSNVDALVENTEDAIASHERLKCGLLHRLIKPTRVDGLPTRNYGKSWRKCTLASLGKIVGGGTPSTKNPDYWGGDIPWATPTDVTSLESNFILKTKRSITKKGLSKSAARLLPKHSILITTRATIGELAINTVPMATNQGFHSLCCNRETNFMFAFYLLHRHRSKFFRYADGTTFLEIGKTDLDRIKVQVPATRQEQQKIASILSGIDARLTLTMPEFEFLIIFILFNIGLQIAVWGTQHCQNCRSPEAGCALTSP